MPNTIITNLSPQDELVLRSAIGRDVPDARPLTVEDVETIALNADQDSVLRVVALQALQAFLALQGQGQYIGGTPMGSVASVQLTTGRAGIPQKLTRELLNAALKSDTDSMRSFNPNWTSFYRVGQETEVAVLSTEQGKLGIWRVTITEETFRKQLKPKFIPFDEAGKTSIHKGVYFAIDGLDVVEMKQGRRSGRNRLRRSLDVEVARYRSAGVQLHVTKLYEEQNRPPKVSVPSNAFAEAFTKEWFEALRLEGNFVGFFDMGEGRRRFVLVPSSDSEMYFFFTTTPSGELCVKAFGVATIDVVGIREHLRTKLAAVLPQELTPDLMKNNMLPTMVITQEGKLPTGVVSKETEVNEGKQR
ncbi:MAG: hypothetical protein ABII18_05900, partial [bacterium]